MAAILLLASLATAQEIKRPTADIDGGALTTLGCLGANQASASMPLSYDATGSSTSSSQSAAGDTAAKYRTRVFKTWQTTGNAYSQLTLNVYSSSSGSNPGPAGQACVAFTVNNGTTWTKILCDTDFSNAGWGVRTSTVTLSPTLDFSQLRVGVCVKGGKQTDPENQGTDSITVFDIWTNGNTNASSGGPGSTAGQAQRGTVVSN